MTGEGPDSNVENVYRFFNPDKGGYLFTTFEVERDFIQDNLDNFVFEGVDFAAYNTDIGEETIPVHRFYDPSAGVHFFTPDEAERESLEADSSNYTYEGVAYYAIDLDL